MLEQKPATTEATLTDDAYFGLLAHLGAEAMTESLFGKLANLHEDRDLTLRFGEYSA